VDSANYGPIVIQTHPGLVRAVEVSWKLARPIRRPLQYLEFLHYCSCILDIHCISNWLVNELIFKAILIGIIMFVSGIRVF